MLGFIEEQNEEQSDIDIDNFIGNEDYDVAQTISMDKQLQMLHNEDPAFAKHVVDMIRKHAEESSMVKKALSEV